MSVAPDFVPRAPAPASRRRAVLAVVPVREAAGARAPFAVAVVGLLVSGLLGLLGLNTVLAKDAFRLHTLQAQARALADQEQALTREVEAARAPSTLAASATRLGMVQAGPPAFLRLPDGAVLGSPAPAQLPPPPAVPGPEAPAPPRTPPVEPAAEKKTEDG